MARPCCMHKCCATLQQATTENSNVRTNTQSQACTASGCTTICVTVLGHMSATCTQYKWYSQGPRVLARVLVKRLGRWPHLCACRMNVCLFGNQCLNDIHMPLTCSIHQRCPTLHELAFMFIVMIDNIQWRVARLRCHINLDRHTTRMPITHDARVVHAVVLLPSARLSVC